MLYPNGFVVQHLNQPCISLDFIKHFPYRGICAYNAYPLSEFSDKKFRQLTDEMMTGEFITEPDLFRRCINACQECGIPIRILFIESGYSGEVWKGPEIQRSLLGYEYNTIPFDDQIITDLEWYEPLSEFWESLTEDGLFPTEEMAYQFKTAYDKAFHDRHIGDGEMAPFIFRVSKVSRDSLKGL